MDWYDKFLLRRRFFGGTPSGLLLLARDQHLPAPTTNKKTFETSMLDLGNIIGASVRIWDVYFIRFNDFNYIFILLCTHMLELFPVPTKF